MNAGMLSLAVGGGLLGLAIVLAAVEQRTTVDAAIAYSVRYRAVRTLARATLALGAFFIVAGILALLLTVSGSGVSQ